MSKNKSQLTLTNETKEKFDALLKVALAKVKTGNSKNGTQKISSDDVRDVHKSTEKLIENHDNTTYSTDSDSNDVIEKQRPKSAKSKRRIKEKLRENEPEKETDELKTSAGIIIPKTAHRTLRRSKHVEDAPEVQSRKNSNLLADEKFKSELNSSVVFDAFKKPPVPLPRKTASNLKSGSDSVASSDGTYRVKSPRLEDLQHRFDTLHHNTSRKSYRENRRSSQDSSDATYNIETIAPVSSQKNVVRKKKNKSESRENLIGDILIHNSPSSSSGHSVTVITRNNDASVSRLATPVRIADEKEINDDSSASENGTYILSDGIREDDDDDLIIAPLNRLKTSRERDLMENKNGGDSSQSNETYNRENRIRKAGSSSHKDNDKKDSARSRSSVRSDISAKKGDFRNRTDSDTVEEIETQLSNNVTLPKKSKWSQKGDRGQQLDIVSRSGGYGDSKSLPQSKSQLDSSKERQESIKNKENIFERSEKNTLSKSLSASSTKSVKRYKDKILKQEFSEETTSSSSEDSDSGSVERKKTSYEEVNEKSSAESITKSRILKNRHKHSSEEIEMIDARKFKSREETIVVDRKKSKRKTIKEKKSDEKRRLDYKKIIAVTIHRSDLLKMDSLITHPMVKVHFVKMDTGEYLKKSDPARPVSFYYESKDVDFITPLITKNFNFKEKGSIIPQWEETLIFNDDIEYILRENEPVLILFEILDFVSFSVASSQYQQIGMNGGWHKIAWAFLKPAGKNGHFNINTKLRLQLYKPIKLRKKKNNTGLYCEAYDWFLKRGPKHKYPATLYVTVAGFVPSHDMPRVMRSRLALQQEYCSDYVEDDSGLTNSNEHTEYEMRSDDRKRSNIRKKEDSIISKPKWSRLPAQSCKIPNKLMTKLPTASKGCLVVKFSNDGLLLACAVVGQNSNKIVIYTIPSGNEYLKFSGHQGLVYSLHWSADSKYLLSASADCTALIWDVKHKLRIPVQMLPHPSYVYIAIFDPTSADVSIVTGCYDRVVRVWTANDDALERPFDLCQELERHTGYVTSLCFDLGGNNLYSGDSDGSVMHWEKRGAEFVFKRKIKIRDMKETVINALVPHPAGFRLLVHARDSLLRMLDLNTGCVTLLFKGALNHSVQTTCTISPCGNLVVCPGEDGTICVWNADTGTLLATYCSQKATEPINSVDYHPYDHIMAIASYGQPSPILLCNYDSNNVTGDEIGLRKTTDERSRRVEDDDGSRTNRSDSTVSTKSKKRAEKISSENEEPITSRSDSVVTQGRKNSICSNERNFDFPVINETDGLTSLQLAGILEKMDKLLHQSAE